MESKPPAQGKGSRRQRRRFYHTMVLLGIGIVFTLIALLVRPFYSANLWLSDQLFVAEAPSPNIVIVGIDNATLEVYGKWSDWPRSRHAQAIDN
ncbi:CHASE2 domain-containing protein, partial [Chloroflexota bacterium]